MHNFRKSASAHVSAQCTQPKMSDSFKTGTYGSGAET